jgi:hypothetical protein
MPERHLCAVRAGIAHYGESRTASVRGMFLMGSCQECVVEADGRRVAACQEPVRAGPTYAASRAGAIMADASAFDGGDRRRSGRHHGGSRGAHGASVVLLGENRPPA